LGLLAAATIASAAPIRLIVISTSTTASRDPDNVLAHLRFGHAAAQAMPSSVPNFIPFSGTPLPATKHTGCGGKFRSKMKDVSNSWRKMFGFDPIEEYRTPDILPPGHPSIVNSDHPVTQGPGGEFHILPFIPESRMRGDGHHSTAWMKATASRVVPVDGDNMYHSRHRQTSFLHRLHRAMTVLSPWEGRAISFVLGCGLGVLIRMFYVLVLVIVRARKTNRPAVALVNDNQEQATLIVTPPSYIVDEKKEYDAQVPASN